jgi:hypothetical protein
MKKYIYIASVMLMLLLSIQSFSDSVSLTWTPSPDGRMNTMSPSGYMIVYGKTSGNYNQSTNVGNVTNCVVSGLSSNTVYYISCYAFAGTLQSTLANEVIWTNVLPLLPPQTLKLKLP